MCMIQGMQSLSWLLRQQLCPHTHSGTTDRISRIETSDFATSKLFFCNFHTLIGNVGDKMLSMVEVHLYIHQENLAVGSLQRWFSVGTHSG